MKEELFIKYPTGKMTTVLFTEIIVREEKPIRQPTMRIYILERAGENMQANQGMHLPVIKHASTWIQEL